MRFLEESLTRAEIERRVGRLSQIGGTRHYELVDGAERGTRAVDVDTGDGFVFTVLPDRGMDISRAVHRGANLVYQGPGGETHPSFYDPRGFGWIRLFFGGLLTTCGVRSFGPPGEDDGEELGLHGRVNVTPAVGFADVSHWDGEEYVLELRGTVEEVVALGPRMRMERTITARLGEPSLRIRDIVRNDGATTSPFLILYHINPGFPLLGPGTELSLASKSCLAYEDHTRGHEKDALRFGPPTPGWKEQNFLHTVAPGLDGRALVCFSNPRLLGGMALWIRYDPSVLPYFSEWKMLGEADYVVGLEPCNAQILPRKKLREQGRLPVLEPGQTREMIVEIGIADGPARVAALKEEIASALGDAFHV
jgi:hypothetical protein